MINGEITVAHDGNVSTNNKAIIANYLDAVIINGRKENRDIYYFNMQNVIRHNLLAEQDSAFQYMQVHKILAEQNFVLSVSEGRLNGNCCSCYDLFRLEQDKIIEHWDTIETIPPRAAWKNGNGKFNFTP